MEKLDKITQAERKLAGLCILCDSDEPILNTRHKHMHLLCALKEKEEDRRQQKQDKNT